MPASSHALLIQSRDSYLRLLAHAPEDIAYLLGEVERLKRDGTLLRGIAAHHIAARGLVEYDGTLLVTPDEKRILEDHRARLT